MQSTKKIEINSYIANIQRLRCWVILVKPVQQPFYFAQDSSWTERSRSPVLN